MKRIYYIGFVTVLAIQFIFCLTIYLYSDIYTLDAHHLRAYNEEEVLWLYERLDQLDFSVAADTKDIFLYFILYRNYLIYPIEMVICVYIFFIGATAKRIDWKQKIFSFLGGMSAYILYLLVTSFKVFPCVLPIALIPMEIIAVMIIIGLFLCKKNI